MKRRAALALAAAGIGIAASSPLWAPPALRQVGWFGARRVEVSGTRLLAPHEVLAASGVRIGANVWTDAGDWESALERHPVISEATVTRRLPHTLRIRVTEKSPAALIEAGTLRPATADGEVLPVDPARAAVDLPLVTARVKTDDRRRISDPGARVALAEAARLGALDPALMARVSELRPAGKGEVRLVMDGADVLLRAGADEPALVRLRAALDDVARRAVGDSVSTGRVVVDARFDDQVVVRREKKS
ncbi:MAG TPA: FtsQ-type POTRA domain-containing protein [Longimicrobium sp.]|nr:FtsQ-type POTRA domain-containing protein [Longimicrobium sp.]